MSRSSQKTLPNTWQPRWLTDPRKKLTNPVKPNPAINPLDYRSSSEWKDWRWQLTHTIRSLDDLRRVPAAACWIASLADEKISQIGRVLESYQMGITPYYLSLIQSFDKSDPIFVQIVPQEPEIITTEDELDDPIGDANPELHTQPVSTITHRYPDRVLFFPNPICAVYCRFCFRKRLVGQAAFVPKPDELEAGFHYIAQHPEIREVILTGGDPLMLSDNRLIAILERLAAIGHVQILRIHTRLPVVNPFRFTPDLARRLSSVGKPVRIVTHFNHPGEITPVAVEYLDLILAQGMEVLNQTVLLRGVNADAAVLAELVNKLTDNHIQPYYLHHPDKVRGTSHFRLSIAEGRQIYNELLRRSPDRSMPQYVLDLPGGHGKIPVTDDYIRPISPGRYLAKTLTGTQREYRDSDSTSFD